SDSESHCRLCSSFRGSERCHLLSSQARDQKTCTENCFERRCTAVGSSTLQACPFVRLSWQTPRSDACGAGSVQGCQKTCRGYSILHLAPAHHRRATHHRQCRRRPSAKTSSRRRDEHSSNLRHLE